MNYLKSTIVALILLVIPAAGQGGCCCSSEWRSEGPSFDSNGKTTGTFKMYYSLDLNARIDLINTNGIMQSSFISNVTFGWNINHITNSCHRTNTSSSYEQLCWDASNPLWHLETTHGVCPNCEIDWKYIPTGSRWLTKRPCNAVSHWGPIMSMPWFGGNFSTINAGRIPSRDYGRDPPHKQMVFPMTPQVNWTSNGMATKNVSDVESVSSVNTVSSTIDQLKVKMKGINHKLSDVDFQLYEIERAEQESRRNSYNNNQNERISAPQSPALDHILQTVTDSRQEPSVLPSKASTYEPLRPIRPMPQQDKAAILQSGNPISNFTRAPSVDSDAPFPFEERQQSSEKSSNRLRRVPRQVSVESPKIPSHGEMQPLLHSNNSVRSKHSIPRQSELRVVIDDPPIDNNRIASIHQQSQHNTISSPRSSLGSRPPEINKLFGSDSPAYRPSSSKSGGSLQAFLRQSDVDNFNGFRKSPTPPSVDNICGEGNYKPIRSRTPLEEILDSNSNIRQSLGDDETALHLQQLRQQQIIVRQHAVADKQWRHQRKLEDVIQRQETQIRMLQEQQLATESEVQSLMKRLY